MTVNAKPVQFLEASSRRCQRVCRFSDDARDA
jgi:hypothetical protein